MTEYKNEKLSAFLDGEMSAESQKSLQADLTSNDDVRETSLRYNMIGQAIRQEKIDIVNLDVADRVRDALASEPAILAPKNKQNVTSRFSQTAWGAAVAASVALVALFVLPPALETQQDDAGVPDFSKASNLAVLPDQTAITTVSSQQWITEPKQRNEKLNRYLMEHNEIAGRTGINGAAPQVNVVSYSAY